MIFRRSNLTRPRRLRMGCGECLESCQALRERERKQPTTANSAPATRTVRRGVA